MSTDERKPYTWTGNHCFVPGIGEPKTGDTVYLSRKQYDQFKHCVESVKDTKSVKGGAQ